MDTHDEDGAGAQQFSCFIIGESSLTVGCADLLRAAGHRIAGIVSAHAAVAAWARERGVRLIDPVELEATLAGSAFDHLFSIVNFRIIPGPVLRSPRGLAINFHDGPLPRYAGMHVTSWAILRGEREHGVTWHVMTEDVDAGPILQQRTVPIAPDETALTLNARCYDAALESFAALVLDLAAGTASGRAQDPAERSYFPPGLRPPFAAVIDWQRPAGEISALVRALDFGPYPNPLDRPKLAHGHGFWVCPQVEAVAAPVLAPPGTLVAAGPDGLVIAAADGHLRIPGLLTLEGGELALEEVLQESGLRTGDVLQRPAALLERATALFSRVARYEPYWASRLRGLRAVPPAFAASPAAAERDPAAAGGENRQVRVPFELPAEFVRGAPGRHGGRDAAEQAIVVFGAYLARIGGEPRQDIWLAHPGLQDMDGLEHLFAAEVPMRVEVGDEDSFESLGASMLAELDRARQHETFARTLRARDPAAARPGPGKGAEPDAGVALVASLADSAPPAGPLRLVLELGTGRCELRYDAALLAPDAASRMIGHFITLLGSVAAEPAVAFRYLRMLTPGELDRLVLEPNDTAAALPPQATIHQLIEAQVARTPDAIAVVSGDLALTYRELDERAEGLAARLRREGVGPEWLVAVLVPRSIDMVVAPLAVLKAGGAYLPLDPAHPPDRIAFVLEDSRARILVRGVGAGFELGDGAGGAFGSLTIISTEAAGGTTAPDPPAPAAPPGGESLAYVLYTSGSTGRPKGVEITHAAVVNFLASMAREPGLSARDTLLAVTTLTFDIAGLELWLPLTVGARVVIAPWEATFDGGLLAGELDRSGATVMQATPVTWKLLIDAGWRGRTGFRALCGGEAMSVALANELLDRCHEVWNLYGPTETTIWSTAVRVERGKPISLGTPISNTRIYLLDRAEQPVPLGVPGEIHIGGAGVARGYLGRPELTAERFVADCLSPVPGARRYRTGDLARRRDDGTLEYLGRVDFQIKLRGFRIELGEIEAVLARHAGVQAAVAVAHGEIAADRRIIAYYVPRAGTGATEADLRTHLRQDLPDYMMPSVLIPLRELPLTHSGKIDRKALPAPDPASLPRRAELVAPRTQLERLLVTAWEEILEVAVGVTDDFFELGGNSLAAVRMLHRVQADLGRSVAIGEFFRHPTVEQLAGAVVEVAGIVDAPIMQLQAGAQGVTPVHFLHGDFTFGGIYAHNVSRYMPPDQPVYLLEPPAPGEFDSIEAAARGAVGHIRSVQPAGPYLLLGVCNGGVIAFEAARQLAAAGDAVLDVIAVNASGSNSMLGPVELFARVMARARGMTEPERVALFLDLRERVMRHAAMARRRGQSGLPAIGTRMLLRGMRNTLRRLSSGVRPRDTADREVELSPPDSRGRHIALMMHAYVPRHYDGHMTLVLSHEDANQHLPDPTAGWGRVVPRIEVFTVPGNHHDSLVGHASSLGSTIAAILLSAQQRRTASIDNDSGHSAA